MHTEMIIRLIYPLFLQWNIGRRNWGRSVNIASSYQLDDRGSIPGRCRDFFFVTASGLALREHPDGFFCFVKRSVEINANIFTHLSSWCDAEKAWGDSAMFTLKLCFINWYRKHVIVKIQAGCVNW